MPWDTFTMDYRVIMFQTADKKLYLWFYKYFMLL